MAHFRYPAVILLHRTIYYGNFVIWTKFTWLASLEVVNPVPVFEIHGIVLMLFLSRCRKYILSCVISKVCFCFKHKELLLCSRAYKINSHLEFHEIIWWTLHTAYSIPIVGSRYNKVKSLRIPDSRHPIASLFGGAMGCLLHVQSIFSTSLIVI